MDSNCVTAVAPVLGVWNNPMLRSVPWTLSANSGSTSDQYHKISWPSLLIITYSIHEFPHSLLILIIQVKRKLNRLVFGFKKTKKEKKRNIFQVFKISGADKFQSPNIRWNHRRLRINPSIPRILAWAPKHHFRHLNHFGIVYGWMRTNPSPIKYSLWIHRTS